MNFNETNSRLLASRNIDLTLDVGANAGQFAKRLREEYRYPGKIISFEPLTDAYARLSQAADADPNWTCVNVALGDVEGPAVINVSANSLSSSMLNVTPRTLEIEPSIRYVGQQNVTVRRLDEVLCEISPESRSIFLKMDVQGFEKQVLAGSLKILDRIQLIQIETSLVSVYVNDTQVGDMIKMLDFLGFRIVSVQPGWHDSYTGELLEMDLMLARK